jgi:hypothetical protein
MNNNQALTQEQVERATERCRLIVEQLAEETGIAFTFGYIGNLDHRGGDSRLWYAFAPHPGRVGKESDSIGGYRTAEIDRLVPYLAGALKLARIQNRKAVTL